MGKIRAEGDGEVQEMIDIGDFAVGLSPQLYGLTMHSERPGHRMYEQWHPLGLVGIITAFNFPVAVWAWNAAIAAVCGDISIWKPSPKTPLSAIAVHADLRTRVMADYGLPGRLPALRRPWQPSWRDAFVDDRRMPLISFTGSTQVGRMVGERVAQRMGRSLLELGGNNAIIVDESADLKLAIPRDRVRRGRHRPASAARRRAACSCTNRSSTTCSASCSSAYEQVERRSAIRREPTTLMGPLNSTGRRRPVRVARVEKAKASGGKVVTGGKALPIAPATSCCRRSSTRA